MPAMALAMLGILAGVARADPNQNQPPKMVLAMRVASALPPAPVHADSTPAAPNTSSAQPSIRGAAWFLLGGSALLLGGATVLNVAGRERMDNCRMLYAGHNLQGARSEYSAAELPGYTSYVLFAVGAAAGAAGMGLVLVPSQPDALTLSVVPANGLSVRLDGRF
jgi:hypothetical protein